MHMLTYLLFIRFVYVWDTVTRKILYKLPGHNGSVNDVDFHPDEPICKSLLSLSVFNAYPVHNKSKL